MPYENTHAIPPRTWICITPNGAVAALRAQCQGPYGGHLVANQSTTVPPTGTGGSVMMTDIDMITPDVPVSTLFPGAVVSGAAVIWCYSESATSISVQHG